MALTNGMPIESVSRILGHTNITTTQIYAKITTEKLNTDLTALGNSYTLSLVNSLVIARNFHTLARGFLLIFNTLHIVARKIARKIARNRS